MSKMRMSSILCILLLSLGALPSQGQDLVAGHVLFRHGDRTPVGTFPSDPVKADDWPNGYGQLTETGVGQHYRLGGYIRERYNSLLNSTYIASEIQVRSTDFDRTLMSAQSNLAGLYPVPSNSSDKVPIQPIPIHTEPIAVDFLLGQNICPRYDQIEEEVDESDDVKKANEFYASFFKDLSRSTNVTNITVYSAWDIADTINVEHIYNKAPAWANDTVRQKLGEVNDLAFHYLFANNDSKRIRGGPSIQDIWTNINGLLRNQSFRKVKMYSAHDTTLSAVLGFLGINYPHQPQYASALFVDLYKQNDTYFVQVEYLNVTDSRKPYSYKLDGCPAEMCPLDVFTSIYQPRFPASADIECAIVTPSTTSTTSAPTTTTTMGPMPGPGGNNTTLIVVLVVFTLVLVAVIAATFWLIQRRQIVRDPPLLGIDRSLQRV